ncbi:hypothetical protein ROA7450_01620 [Roseovarius albus]|uniref:Uncharacterized protein n=1 Tax=Roseovarius albus TaxID=1247867 RepID=A0A1X6YYC8_9RHOB|nr:hypothetical protein [Roseovarius albus]SLN34952.1 hypothetical protein ROA7450_01620 [Roseovarius albus]
MELDELYQKVRARIFDLMEENPKNKTLEEIQVSLEVLYTRCKELVELNNAYLSLPEMNQNYTYFDPKTEIYTEYVGGKVANSRKLNRASKDVPIELVSSVNLHFFVPQPLTFENNTERYNIERQIAEMLDNFYYKASRTWDIIEKTLCGKKKSKFIGVKRVRNKLLEHATLGELNSYGATDSKNGPTVKPLRKTPWDGSDLDNGVIKNMKELLENTLSRLT